MDFDGLLPVVNTSIIAGFGLSRKGRAAPRGPPIARHRHSGLAFCHYAAQFLRSLALRERERPKIASVFLRHFQSTNDAYADAVDDYHY